MIDLGKIPTFTGKLEELETHAGALKTTASSIRGTGKDVHNAFQALDPVYDAPEREHLLNSTIPVRDRADEFAKKLESVSGALTSFASSAKPLVDKMNQLRADAKKFVDENKDDDDWQQDQGKIDENARLVREVGTTWVAFQGVERDAANKITALVGGTHFIVDDGSHKAGMYGFKESDVKDAKETPWGTVDEREYTGLRAAWEWTKDNVGGALKGFFVDGVWGTIKGLGSMVNVFDWDNFKKTWSNIGDVFGGVSAYIMTPYDWAMDKMFGPVDHSDTDKQKAALRNFGKSLVAWDEWGKNPSKAVGIVAFNGLTLGAGSFLKLGKAGKAGLASEAATVMGKAGVLVDPMSYLGKAASVTKLKVGDLMESLKVSQAGVDDMARNVPTGTSPHPTGVNPPSAHTGDGSSTPSTSGEGSSTPSHTGNGSSTPSHTGDGSSTPSHSGDSSSTPAGSGEKTPAGSGEKTPAGREYEAPDGEKYVVGADGHIRDTNGDVVPDKAPHQEPHKDDLPNVKEPETVPVKEPVKEKVLEGAGGPSRVETGTGAGSHTPSGGGTGHGTGGHGETPGTGGGAGGHGGSDGPGGSGKDSGSADSGSGSGSDKGSGTGHGAGAGHTGDSGAGSGSGDSGSGSGDSGAGDSGTGSGSGSGDSGSGDSGSGAGDSGSGDHTPPGTYKPGPAEEIPPLKRHDADFSDTHNSKGQRKSYLNEDGDLVPANPNGDATIVDHIVGREPKKSESPYTSTSEDGANAKDYGGQKIQIDLPRLVDDIAKGKVKGVEVYSPKEVEAAIQQAADKVAGRPVDITVPRDTPHPEIDARAAEIAKELGLGKAKTKSLAQRMKDMMHTRRDSEWLIKGVVPRDYISGP